MDYLKNIILDAEKLVGGTRALEDLLSMSRNSLSMVKAGERGMPDIAQDKLEKLMNLEGGSLRAASAIITEKKPEAKAYWEKKLESLAAGLIFFVVTINMSPTPAEAAPALSPNTPHCILCQIKEELKTLKKRFLQALQMSTPENFRRLMVSRVDHMTA